MLTFSQLREANVKRANYPTWGDDPWDTADWMVALVGEVGELANKLKKIRRGVMYPGMEMPTLEDLAEEFADIQTYLDLLAHNCGIDLGEATKEKWNRVSDRWNIPEHL